MNFQSRFRGETKFYNIVVMWMYSYFAKLKVRKFLSSEVFLRQLFCYFLPNDDQGKRYQGKR